MTTTSIEKTPLLIDQRTSDVESNHGDDDRNHPTASSSSSSSHLLQSRLLLLGVALVYGSLNVILRMVYERPDPPTASVLSTTRGWMAVLCFLPLLRLAKTPTSNNACDLDNTEDNEMDITTATASLSPDSSPARSSDSHHNYQQQTIDDLDVRDDNRHYLFWWFALELAVFDFGSQGLLNVGLVTTASARASFLVQLSVVITPTISAVLGHKVHRKVWCACGIALVGLYLLSCASSSSSSSSSSNERASLLSIHFTTGDLYCLGSAVCWSYYIYRLSAWGEYFDEIMTQFCKNIFLASMYATWMVLSLLLNEQSLWLGWRDPISWMLLFYSAFGPSTIADIVQQKAQSIVAAAESNVILSLEPVFTAILGMMLLGEGLSGNELIGGSLIVVASVLANY